MHPIVFPVMPIGTLEQKKEKKIINHTPSLY